MKVLFVSEEYPPATAWGGIGTYAGIMAPALARAGAEVHVLSVSRQHRERRTDERAPGLYVHLAPVSTVRGAGRVTRLPQTWRRLSQAWSVSRAHRRLDTTFDVVEFPEWNAEGLLDVRRHRDPTVIRLHSSAAQVYAHVGPLDRDLRFAIRLEDSAVRAADVVTGTRAQVTDVAPRLGLAADAVREITYPVVPPAPEPLAAARTICFAGRFETRKGPETLVRAMPAIVAAVPDARLVMVGRDTATPEHASMVGWLRELAGRLGVTSAVDVVEEWGTDAVLRWLRSSRVCAVPSLWESFGYVAAEAAGLGRPVVASDIAALTEIVVDGETGRLVPPHDVERWSDALIEMLTSPRAEAMGRAGADHIARTCDPDRVAALTLDAYGDAIARRRASKRVAADVQP